MSHPPTTDGFVASDAGRRLNPRYRHADYIHLVDLRSALALHSRSVSGSVLDYGCGTMPYRSLFRAADQYIGADFDSNGLAELHLDPDGRVPLPDQSVDGIVSIQVLEHVPDPHQYLEECRRLLRPGGRILISTHGAWEYHPVPSDYQRWTPEGLERLLAGQGFHVEVGLGVTDGVRASMQLFLLATRFRRWALLVRGALRLGINLWAKHTPRRPDRIRPWAESSQPLVIMAVAVLSPLESK